MKKVVLSLLVVLLVGSLLPVQAQESEPQVVNAVEGVLAAFDSYPVVAIGEQHGIHELGEFYQALLRHPEFAEKVDALVLEYGNALYQDVVDRYVAGEEVPYSELQKAWSDVVGKVPGGTEIMYLQLYSTVREINQTLPEGEKIRILLGDPPINWAEIETQAQVMDYQFQRESHFANVVISEVLDKNLKALVIIGGPHLDRNLLPMVSQPMDTPPSGEKPPIPMVMQQIVEQAHPGKTYVIIVHTGFSDDACNAEVEGKMADWQVPALATVKGTWLETLDCEKFPAAIMVATQDNVMQAPAGSTPPEGLPPMKSLIGGADAYLYVGNRDALTMSPFDPSIYMDMAYFNEQSRRHELMFGSPLTWDAQDNPHFYVDNFPQ